MTEEQKTKPAGTQSSGQEMPFWTMMSGKMGQQACCGWGDMMAQMMAMCCGKPANPPQPPTPETTQSA